jgi:hypothetical protein
MADFVNPRSLTTTQAMHFARWPTIAARTPPESYKGYLKTKLTPGQVIQEPSSTYDVFRCHALREADRALFLSLSNYRRSLDLLTTSSASWAWVTSYYSAFYSASAILGMLGVSLDPFEVIVGVEKGNPNGQRLIVQEFTRRVTLAQSTHEAFWEMFDRLVAPVRREFPPKLQDATKPSEEGVEWQIRMRNSQNYDTFAAIDTARQFAGSFRRDNFPGCLSGDFEIQYETTVGLINLALWLSHYVGLSTDALHSLSGQQNTRKRGERLIGSVRSPFPGRHLFKPGAPSGPLSVLF